MSVKRMWSISLILFTFIAILFFSLFFLSFQNNTNKNVNVQVGLLPVYEINYVGNCPVITAAPSIHCFDIFYQQCDTCDYQIYKGNKDSINPFLCKLSKKINRKITPIVQFR